MESWSAQSSASWIAFAKPKSSGSDERNSEQSDAEQGPVRDVEPEERTG